MSSSVLSEDDTEASRIDVKGTKLNSKNSVNFIPGDLIINAESTADIRSIRLNQEINKTKLDKKKFVIDANDSKSSL